jgi:hypothetical protein
LLFYIRFKEHFHDYKYGNGKSKFAQHLSGNKYSIGSMEEIMEILHITRKGGMMNTLERFHIYNKTKLDNRIKYKFTIKSKVIFDTIIQRNTSKGHSPL